MRCRWRSLPEIYNLDDGIWRGFTEGRNIRVDRPCILRTFRRYRKVVLAGNTDNHEPSASDTGGKRVEHSNTDASADCGVLGG